VIIHHIFLALIVKKKKERKEKEKGPQDMGERL
jgi:hypothetical protein